jgi:hypothetical protein
MSSGTSRRSKRKARKSAFGIIDVALVAVAVAALGSIAAWWHFVHGYTLYYGDALSHLGHARRVIDSRTPGAEQLGTVWLPLPHLLMLPFARVDSLWWSGLAGVFPSVAAFAAAGAFLYAAVRRIFSTRAAALTAVLVFALNPNVLYMQSIPMTEPVLQAAMFALLYFCVWYRQTGSMAALALLGAASNAGYSFRS